MAYGHYFYPVSQPRAIILVTSSFPFGDGEPFLHLEVEYLKQWFDRVVVLSCNEKGTGLTSQHVVFDNFEAYHLNTNLNLIDRLGQVPRLFTHPDVRDEIQVVSKVYKQPLSLGHIKTLLVSLAKAEKIAQRLTHLAHQLKNEGYIVTTYSYWAMEGALAAALVKRNLPSHRAVCRAHAWDVYFERSHYGYLPFRKLIYTGLDAVFFISENARQYALAQLPGLLNRQRMLHARLGIRTSDSQLNFSRMFRSFRVVSCSYLIAIKRVERIIDALSLIQNMDVEWTHFGDGPMLNQLRAYATQKFADRPNIRWELKGRVANWEILQFYATHPVDAFLSVSRFDGIPVSIMEAMSFGIPAVATHVGGVAEIVVNDANGVLLNEDPTPIEVASALRKMAVMSDGECLRMREAARAMWGQFYNAEVNYYGFCETLCQLQTPVNRS